MGKKSSKLKPELLKDIAQDNNCTEKEITKFYKTFKQECPTGKLTLKEFKQVYSSNFPLGNADKFSEHMFRTFDHDHDGKIDFKEFIFMLWFSSKSKNDDKLKWAFNMYDLDGDGVITKTEMEEIVSSIYKMVGNHVKRARDEDTPEKKTKKFFEQMDLNKDGVLTLEEFVEGAKKDSSIMSLLEAATMEGLTEKPEEEHSSAETIVASTSQEVVIEKEESSTETIVNTPTKMIKPKIKLMKEDSTTETLYSSNTPRESPHKP